MNIVCTKTNQTQLQDILLPGSRNPFEVSIFMLRVELQKRAYPTSLLARACAAGFKRYTSQQLRPAASGVELTWSTFRSLAEVGADDSHLIHALAVKWAAGLRPELRASSDSPFIGPEDASKGSFQSFYWALKRYMLGVNYVTACLAESCADLDRTFTPEQVREAVTAIGLDWDEFCALKTLGQNTSHPIFDALEEFHNTGRRPSEFEFHPDDAEQKAHWDMVFDHDESEAMPN